MAINLTLENLRRIGELCRAHDIPVLLAIFPYLSQLEGATSAGGFTTSAVLLDFAKRNRIHVVDLAPQMRARFADEGRGPRAYMFGEVHPSSEGHRVVSEILTRHIRQSGVLAKSQGGRRTALPEVTAKP
jgi:hypothetical protein